MPARARDSEVHCFYYISITTTSKDIAYQLRQLFSCVTRPVAVSHISPSCSYVCDIANHCCCNVAAVMLLRYNLQSQCLVIDFRQYDSSMGANGRPHNDPFSAPAHNTRSHRSLQEFTSLGTPVPVDSESRMDDYIAAASSCPETVPASPKHRHIDSVYAPPVYHGRSSDDALDFLRYVERFSTYKQMTKEECLQSIPISLRDAASDFYDSLDEHAKSSWQDFRAAFLAHFGKSAKVTI